MSGTLARSLCKTIFQKTDSPFLFTSPAAACRSFAGRALAKGYDLPNGRAGMVHRAPIPRLPARLEFLGFDIGTGDDEIASDPAHGEGGHRRPLPQSSSTSRFTASHAGFLHLSQSG